jgi:hypothetical protein
LRAQEFLERYVVDRQTLGIIFPHLVIAFFAIFISFVLCVSLLMAAKDKASKEEGGRYLNLPFTGPDWLKKYEKKLYVRTAGVAVVAVLYVIVAYFLEMHI